MQCNAVCLYEAGQCIGLWCCRRSRLRCLLRCGGGGGWGVEGGRSGGGGVEGGGGGVCYEDSPNCAALVSATRCPRVLLSPPASSKQLTPVMSTLCFLCTKPTQIFTFTFQNWHLASLLSLSHICLANALPFFCIWKPSWNFSLLLLNIDIDSISPNQLTAAMSTLCFFASFQALTSNFTFELSGCVRMHFPLQLDQFWSELVSIFSIQLRPIETNLSFLGNLFGFGLWRWLWLWSTRHSVHCVDYSETTDERSI